jgi:serine/threonine protein kinase/WD40 repeat protein
VNPSQSSDPLDNVLVEIELAIEGLTPAERTVAIRDYAERHPEFRDGIFAHFELGEWIRPPELLGDFAKQFRPGEWLGEFRILRFITRGGMGEVYEAREESLDRHVALKVIKKGTVHPTARSRFRREEQVLAKLHHTNIVPIYHAGEQDGTQYCAMQFVRGASLQGVISELSRTGFTSTVGKPSSSIRQVVESILKSTSTDGAKPTPDTPLETATFDPSTDTLQPGQVPEPAYFESVAALLIPVAEALQHVHEQGICHRDIKPSNLMIDTSGHCWVIDFGLAGIESTKNDLPIEDYLVDEEQLTHGLTHGILGTPVYMAPEQFDERPGPASDIWSLGVTLYELLTLRRPFAGATRKELESAVREAIPTLPRAIVPNVPRDLQAICLKAMEKGPEDRYASAQAFADDLRRWLHWHPTAARPAWATLRPLRLWAWRRKATAAAIAFALLLVGMTTASALQLAERRRAELEHKKNLDKFNNLRNRPPFIGWPNELNKLLGGMEKLQPDVRLIDYRALAFVGEDAKVVLTDKIEQIKNQRRGFSGVAFSPNGKRVVAGGRVPPNTPAVAAVAAKYWSENGTATVSTEIGNGPVAFLDDHTPLQLIEPTAKRKSLLLWNVAKNGRVLEIPVEGTIAKSAIATDAKFVAVTGKDGKGDRAWLWGIDPTNPMVLPKKIVEWNGAAESMAFSPDGRYLAIGTDRGDVTILATSDGKEAMRLPNIRVAVISLAFGRSFAVSGSDQPRLATGGISGWQLAVGTSNGFLQLHDLDSRIPARTIHGFSHYINALAFGPDGTRLAAAGHGNPVLVDVATGQIVFEFDLNKPDNGKREYFTGVAFSPDGRRIAFASVDQFGSPGVTGGLDVLAFESGRGVETYRGLTGWVAKTWLSPSGKWIAGLSHSWQLGVWDRATGHLRFRWDLPVGVLADNGDLAFDPNDESFVFAAGEHVNRYSLTTGQRTATWSGMIRQGLNDRLQVRPDGSIWLLRREFVRPSDGRNTKFILRQLLDGGQARPVYEFDPPDPNIHTYGWSRDGKFLLVFGGAEAEDQKSWLYDGQTGKPILTPNGESLVFEGAGFLTDSGRHIRFQGSEAEPERKTTRIIRTADWQDDKPEPAWGADRTVSDDEQRYALDRGGPEPETLGMRLFRTGRRDPLVTFDYGHRASTIHPHGLTADGRFLHWGRTDGSVRIADVNRCLAALAPFLPDISK